MPLKPATTAFLPRTNLNPILATTAQALVCLRSPFDCLCSCCKRPTKTTAPAFPKSSLPEQKLVFPIVQVFATQMGLLTQLSGFLSTTEVAIPLAGFFHFFHSLHCCHRLLSHNLTSPLFPPQRIYPSDRASVPCGYSYSYL